jgi:hypothetical protein
VQPEDEKNASFLSSRRNLNRPRDQIIVLTPAREFSIVGAAKCGALASHKFPFMLEKVWQGSRIATSLGKAQPPSAARILARGDAIILAIAFGMAHSKLTANLPGRFGAESR